jgi:hypothetical protein
LVISVATTSIIISSWVHSFSSHAGYSELASSVPTRRLLDKHEQCVREVGQALFSTLLGVGEVAGRYRAAAAVAAGRGEGLRVVPRIDDPALAGLPWEAMYDTEVGTYVCRRDQLVRHVGVAAAAAPLAVNAPLRVLGIVASPRGFHSLDAEREKDHLAKALAGNSSVELTGAPSATWTGLQEMLRAILAPPVLIAATALSFAAAFGLSSLLWRYGIGYSGIEAQIPLYIFIFLVALGVDYSILMSARIREASGSRALRCTASWWSARVGYRR